MTAQVTRAVFGLPATEELTHLPPRAAGNLPPESFRLYMRLHVQLAHIASTTKEVFSERCVMRLILWWMHSDVGVWVCGTTNQVVRWRAELHRLFITTFKISPKDIVAFEYELLERHSPYASALLYAAPTYHFTHNSVTMLAPLLKAIAVAGRHVKSIWAEDIIENFCMILPPSVCKGLIEECRRPEPWKPEPVEDLLPCVIS